MMLKKPVTPFTRYSRPAILAVFWLRSYLPSFAHDSLLSYGPSLQPALLCHVRADTASVLMLAISIFRKFEFSRVFSSPKSHEAMCHWHEPEANTGSSRMRSKPELVELLRAFASPTIHQSDSDQRRANAG